MKTIYSLEDDIDISKIIHVSLEKTGYRVYSFFTGKEFLEAFKKQKPDMCLLDLMLPDASGMDILKKLRSDPSNDDMPLVIISAKRMAMDKVEGFDNGADDYIEKPFDILELISRINARFRKSQNKDVLSFKNIEINFKNHSVTKEGEIIPLTNMEFDILSLFFKNINTVISREEIFKKIYQIDNDIESRSIDMHIASLRKKLDDKEGKLIRTIYGIGYIVS